MSNAANSGEIRFSMLKQRHRRRFEEALAKELADKQIVPLCKFLFKQKGFFTSSSCAGRIMLICLPKGEEKKEAFFVAKWHRKVKFSELKKAISDNKNCKKELWFKQEPFILHIIASSIAKAKRILRIAKMAGIKRGGIMHLSKGKIVIELLGTNYIALPVKINNKIIVDDSSLKLILKKANEKLMKNYERLKKFEKILRKELSA